MVVSSQDASRSIPIRAGTGKRQSGQAAARRIVKSAQALLATRGASQFSMRNVAAHAGLHLANLQYYFPTRDALVAALLQDVGHRYWQAYQRCLRSAPQESVARFEAVLAFNLQDIGRRSTRRYFIQLWALLDGLDARSGRRLNTLYETDIAQLSALIAEIDPRAGAAEVRRRATLLAAMLEGLMVVRGAHCTEAREMNDLMQQAQELGFSIAAGRPMRA
jgi:AcrR family transcriptional regulator